MTWLHIPQKVIETCRDHMWSSPHTTQKYSDLPPGHPHHAQLISSGRFWDIKGPAKSPWTQGKDLQNLTVPTIWTSISSGGSCIAWVFFLEGRRKAPGESSSKAIHDPTVPTHIGWCTMWALSKVKANPVIRTTEDMLRCWPHWSVCENCISSLHLASFTQHAIKHDLSVFGD